MKVPALSARARRVLLFSLLVVAVLCLLFAQPPDSIAHLFPLLLFAELLVGFVVVVDPVHAAVGLPLPLSARSPPVNSSL
jgi:hypothetical protein